MDKLNDYTIAFKGLKEGKHHFHYKIGQPFFENIKDSVIEKGSFEVNVTMDKKSQMLQFDFEIDGKVHSICDNCLGKLELPITYTGRLYIKFGIVYDEPSDEIIVLPHDENEFNIAQLIYEYIVISIPLRSVHEDEEECDQDMIDKLDNYSGSNHDNEESNNEAIDPRWEALRKLKDNSN